MMYRSQPCQSLFSSVVKNVASPSLEIKKLVYIYLLRYAEAEPDLALLSINTIQKSLTDSSPQVRALALRVMSGIRVPVISQIVSLAIKKGCGDMSALVRRAAALAVPKCYRLDPGTLPQLRDYLAILLGDRQYQVVGAAVAAFLEVCPDRMELVHRHYRGLVRKLVDMDEWGQLAALRMMAVYARKCFPRRTRRVRKGGGAAGGTGRFYDDDDDDYQDNTQAESEEIQVLDPDLELLLNTCKSLLYSRNSAVIVAVARCYCDLAPPEYIDLAVGPLVSLLRGPPDVQHMALFNIVSVCLARPVSFVKYASHFLVRSTDPPEVMRLKLEVLTIIFPHCGTHLKGVMLNDLEHLSQGSQKELVRECVRAIGRCAQGDTSTAPRCLRLLLRQISSPDGNLVAESLTVIRHLIQQDPTAHAGTVIHLAKNLDTATNPNSRASIIWLVGEFASGEDGKTIAPDVLRLLMKNFVHESEAAKLQIVLLAARVYLHHLNLVQRTSTSDSALEMEGCSTDTRETTKEAKFAGMPANAVDHQKTAIDQEDRIVMLWKYVLLLSRYDISYDLRDRARLYKALLTGPSSTQLATLLLLAPKPVPHAPSPSESRKGFMLGSASLVVGQEGGLNGLPGYDPLPDWVEEGKEPDPKLRDDGTARVGEEGRRQQSAVERLESAARPMTRATGGPDSMDVMNGLSSSGKERTLDDWLAEGVEAEEATEESSEYESSNEEEEEEEEEEGDESEDEAQNRLIS